MASIMQPWSTERFRTPRHAIDLVLPMNVHHRLGNDRREAKYINWHRKT